MAEAKEAGVDTANGKALVAKAVVWEKKRDEYVTKFEKAQVILIYRMLFSCRV